MAQIPSPLIGLLKGTLFENERVIWQGRPDAWADMMNLRIFWWIAPVWLALTAIGIQKGWVEQSAMFFLMAGAAMIVGPFALYITDLQTLFVITDRRALTLRTAWGKPTASSAWYEQIAKLDVYLVKDHVGHLSFVSPTPDKVHDGFRCVKQVEKVRDLLQRALGR
jgi:hypothetical protein